MTKPAPTDGSVKQVHERSCLRTCIQGKKRKKPQMQKQGAQGIKMRRAESQARVPLSIQSRVDGVLGGAPEPNLAIAKPEAARDVSANQVLFGEDFEHQATEHQESSAGLNRTAPAGPVRLSLEAAPSGEGVVADLNVKEPVEEATEGHGAEPIQGTADQEASVRVEMKIDDDGTARVRLLVQDVGDLPSDMADSMANDSLLDTAPVQLVLSVDDDEGVVAAHLLVNEPSEDGWPVVASAGPSASITGPVTGNEPSHEAEEQGSEGKLVSLELRPTLDGVASVKLVPEIQGAAAEPPRQQGSEGGSSSPFSGSPASMGSSTAISPRQRRRPKTTGTRSGQSRFRHRTRVHRRPMSVIPDFGGGFAAPDEVLTETLESVMCPAEIFLQLHREDHATRTMRTITVSSPYWVSNATGHHIVFADHRSAGKDTWNWLCGERFTEVLVPFQVRRRLFCQDPSARTNSSVASVLCSDRASLPS